MCYKTVLLILCFDCLGILSLAISAENLNQHAVETITLMNEVITNQEIAHEHYLLRSLVKNIQAPLINKLGDAHFVDLNCASENICPSNYCEFVQHWDHIFETIKDSHNGIIFTTLNTPVYPRVVSTGSKNSRILPLSNVKKLVLMISPYTLHWQIYQVQEVKDLNGTSVHQLNTTIKTESQLFVDRPLQWKLKEINGTNEFSVLTSYASAVDASSDPWEQNEAIREKAEKIKETIVVNDLFSKKNNCLHITPGSSNRFGSCLTHEGKPLVWINTFDSFEGNEIGLHLEKFLNSLSIDAKTDILLDIRGNRGGNPQVVIDFLCRFGDDKILKTMENLMIQSRPMPMRLTLENGETITMRDLIHRGDNTQAFLNIGLLDEQGLLLRPYMEYFGMSVEKCHELNEPNRGKLLQWSVLNDGSELSTAEHFLYLINKGSDLFHILGPNTAGGTGLPITFVLPKTRAYVTLSTSRLMETISGTTPTDNETKKYRYIIEGQGAKGNYF
ncbi:MAG: hypothetical protein HQK50_14180 [Oligoflexia bacterium]|nr:hypothetical protein [Oligoflexia bacterium]